MKITMAKPTIKGWIFPLPFPLHILQAILER